MATVGALADTIGTVSVRAPRDTPATRLAVSAALGGLALPSLGPSPRAILVVRSVDGLATDARRDPAALSAEVQLQIEKCWRTAQRPWRGAAGANAVVFRDMVELLAQYLVDLTTGRLAERWWWRALHRQLAPSGRVADVLAEHIWFAPQVLAEIRRLGCLLEVAGALDLQSCARLTVELADVHAAPALKAALTIALRPGDAAGRAADTSGVPVAVRDAVVGIDGEARRLFVAAALQLAADPLVARAPSFARGVAALVVEPRHRPTDAEGLAPESRGDRQDQVRASSGPVADQLPSPEPDHQFERSEQPEQGEWREASPIELATTQDAAVALELATSPETPANVVLPIGEPPTKLVDSEHSIESSRDMAIELDDTELLDPFEPLPTVEGVVTWLGGVFFLIEALRQFRAAEPETADWELAARCGWWGVLGGLARRLLPPDHPGADDPVWGVLAELGGGQPRDDLSEWLHDVQPGFVAVLTERLGCGVDELAPVLLERPARIHSNRTHVDVYLPLSSATVAVRRTGFDRDPGWVPELSRVIAFHFDVDPAGQS
jgi:hypothetical protein